MASEAEEPLSKEEKMRIASDFILHSPPGEHNEVFNDVRVLINDDLILKEIAIGPFFQYDKDQLTPVKVEGSNFKGLITHYNDLGSARFYDPRSQQSFKYDFLRKETSDFRPMDPPNKPAEPWRRALEEAYTLYAQDRYKNGTCSVFSGPASEDGKISLIACTEDHQFQSSNYWNGRWRSIWTISFLPDSTTADVEGLIKVRIHYYEDGNIQLVSSKDVKESISISTEQKTANDLITIVEEAETEYQTALSENYQIMSNTTLKALRRKLPVTRTKLDWGKILTLKKLGTELKHH
ncbi:hypothetical protein JTE90_020117 [Oedothorax gibbosus]|uniref:F-actin-capping protein subunit alpha n=1 Tax=Oedothorax gibbosus TaxID=931172 RepID=A0AAV6VP17_9ARAC|nr:hypothetical protein JTE90_020117 [Oedothorax gibbosus]